MAKKKVASGISSGTVQHECLTLNDIPAADDPSASILGISDASTKDKALDAWRAASTIRKSIDFWRLWLAELEEFGDADPRIPGRLNEICSAAFFTLCSLRAFPAIFRENSADDLLSLLPPVPYSTAENRHDRKSYQIPSGKGWQADISFRSTAHDRLAELWELQGECSMILSQLGQGPTAVLGWDDVTPVPDILLNDSEKSICEAINRLWGKGLEWPLQSDIAKEAGLAERVVKESTGHMARFGILEKGPSGHGFKVRT